MITKNNFICIFENSFVHCKPKLITMKAVIFLISLLWISTVQAQDNQQTKMITINPYGPDTVIKSVKFGERIKFKILNVNTFKINGYVTSTPVNIDYGVPSILSNLINQTRVTEIDTTTTEPDPGDIPVPGPIMLGGGIKAKPSRADTIAQKQKAFIKGLSDFIVRYQKIVSYINLEDNLFRKLSDSVFIRDIKVLQTNCTSEYLSIYDDTINFNVAKQKIIKDLSEIDTTYTVLKLIYEELLNMQKEAFFTMNGTLKSQDKKTSLSVTNAEVRLETKKYFEAEYLFVKTVYDQLNDEKNRQTLIEKVHAGIDLYNKIQNEKYIFYTDSEPANGDEVTLTLKLKYSDGRVAKEFTPYQIRTKGGLKVNFSSGYLLSFKGDDNYTVYRDANGGVGASKGNSNTLSHALGALAHVYRRSDKDYNFALSSGISLANNSNLGFYLGCSVLFSEKNRLIISAGISYIQLQKLNSSNLERVGETEKYKFLSASDDIIKYDPVYQPTGFVSITYNLAGKP